MKRKEYLLLVLLLGGVLAFFLWRGGQAPKGPALPGPEDLAAGGPKGSAPRPVPAGSGAEGQPERRPLAAGEEPAAPPAGSEAGVLEGLVRDGAGRGLAGVAVVLAATRLPVEHFSPEAVQRALQTMREVEEKAAANPGAAGESDLLERVAERVGLERTAAAASDAEGRYRFTGIELGAERLFLTALALPGHLPPDPVQVLPAHLGPGRGPDLVLCRGGRIRGFLAGLDSPREGLQLRAWRLGERAPLERRAAWVQGEAGFALEGLRPGSWRLAALRPFGRPLFVWGPVVVLAEGQEIDGIRIGLEPSVLLEVEVLGPGRCPLDALSPAVDLSLRTLGPPGERGEENEAAEHLFSIRREGGVWRLDGLVPGSYRVHASLARTQAWRPSRGGEKEGEAALAVAREVRLARGANRVELVFDRLPALTAVEIAVRDRQGAPVADATVHLAAVGGGLAEPHNGRTGADGLAGFRGLLPFAYQARVFGPGFLPAVIDLDLAGEPGGGRRRREVVLRRGCVVEGRLLDAEGRGVPRVRIVARSQEAGGAGGERAPFAVRGAGQHLAMTDDQGVFRLQNLAPGRWEIAAGGEGGGAPLQVDLGEEESRQVELRL